MTDLKVAIKSGSNLEGESSNVITEFSRTFLAASWCGERRKGG